MAHRRVIFISHGPKTFGFRKFGSCSHARTKASCAISSAACDDLTILIAAARTGRSYRATNRANACLSPSKVSCTNWTSDCVTQRPFGNELTRQFTIIDRTTAQNATKIYKKAWFSQENQGCHLSKLNDFRIYVRKKNLDSLRWCKSNN